MNLIKQEGRFYYYDATTKEELDWWDNELFSNKDVNYWVELKTTKVFTTLFPVYIMNDINYIGPTFHFQNGRNRFPYDSFPQKLLDQLDVQIKQRRDTM